MSNKRNRGVNRIRRERETAETFLVSPLMVDDQTVTIRVKSTFEAGASVDYEVGDIDYPVVIGDDLRCAATLRATPQQMAVSLASFLSAYGEHFYRISMAPYGLHVCHDGYCGEYTPEARAWLAENYERLGNWVAEMEYEDE